MAQACPAEFELVDQRNASRTRTSVSSDRITALPASFIRGGTSKGVFLRREDLPRDVADWKPILLGILGSPDPQYGRQLDGMGGGVSSLSKVCVVGAASEEHRKQGIDVGIRDDAIDVSGNCGNLSSMIGPYALDEGMIDNLKGKQKRTVRAFNTNTQKIIDATFPVTEDGLPKLNIPQTSVAGVPRTASEILLDFVDPAGARTGKLLPTGSPIDRPGDSYDSSPLVAISCVDATNPTVFVRAADLRSQIRLQGYLCGEQPDLDIGTEVLEALRQNGARKMGLDPQAQAQPKIAILSAPAERDDADVVVHALSMGVLHKAVPMTLGLCLGVAANAEGTIAHEIVQEARAGRAKRARTDLVKIRHPGGTVDVGAEFGEDGKVKSARVVRTGRIMMKGTVYW
ncbi:PrpF protein [Schizophyllum amplum]|uniref:PrpF protein n=1 Tax=Schizophyllum amplum TaxID=97359 RepID=A0A550CYB3_9AGAR|nr:PrpF protein [Auriculariopsis ampla]